MTTLQIVLLSIAGFFAVVSIIFMILFIAEISVSVEDEEEAEVKSVFSSEEYSKKDTEVDSMLEKLDKQAEEPAPATVVNVIVTTDEAKAEEPAEEAKEEVVEETAANENAEETANTEESTEANAENSGEVVVVTNLLDYKARLAKVIENKEKLEKELIKVEKSILNYERTKRRKIRNQKMLDRRASELTNLNLVMYSVTDIKNVDEDKKIKQEELTNHIAELKASIQDAEEFLDSNKEKNDHDVKMAKFLIQEKARYNEEIAELEDLIAKCDAAADDATANA